MKFRFAIPSRSFPTKKNRRSVIEPYHGGSVSYGSSCSCGSSYEDSSSDDGDENLALDPVSIQINGKTILVLDPQVGIDNASSFFEAAQKTYKSVRNLIEPAPPCKLGAQHRPSPLTLLSAVYSRQD